MAFRTVTAGATGRRAGFTLLEMMVSIAILGVLMAMAFTLMAGSSRDMQAESAVIAVESEARRALERMAEEIRRAPLNIITGQVPVAPGSIRTITVQEVTGIVAMAPTFGPAITYATQVNPQGWTEVIRTEGGVTIVLASFLQANGLTFFRDANFPNKLNIRLVMQITLPDGQPVTRTVETAVYARN